MFINYTKVGMSVCLRTSVRILRLCFRCNGPVSQIRHFLRNGNLTKHSSVARGSARGALRRWSVTPCLGERDGVLKMINSKIVSCGAVGWGASMVEVASGDWQDGGWMVPTMGSDSHLLACMYCTSAVDSTACIRCSTFPHPTSIPTTSLHSLTHLYSLTFDLLPHPSNHSTLFDRRWRA